MSVMCDDAIGREGVVEREREMSSRENNNKRIINVMVNSR